MIVCVVCFNPHSFLRHAHDTTERSPMSSKAKQYTREALLKSQEFALYQKDFLSVILSKPTYTLAEARKIVKEFFKKERD